MDAVVRPDWIRRLWTEIKVSMVKQQKEERMYDVEQQVI